MKILHCCCCRWWLTMASLCFGCLIVGREWEYFYGRVSSKIVFSKLFCLLFYYFCTCLKIYLIRKQRRCHRRCSRRHHHRQRVCVCVCMCFLFRQSCFKWATEMRVRAWLCKTLIIFASQIRQKLW